MYVIEDKKGRFFVGEKKWTRSLEKAQKYSRLKEMIVIKAWGERVFEVHLVLGKQVK